MAIPKHQNDSPADADGVLVMVVVAKGGYVGARTGARADVPQRTAAAAPFGTAAACVPVGVAAAAGDNAPAAAAVVASAEDDDGEARIVGPAGTSGVAAFLCAAAAMMGQPCCGAVDRPAVVLFLLYAASSVPSSNCWAAVTARNHL